MVDDTYPLSIHRTGYNRDSNRINFMVRGPGGGPNSRPSGWPKVELIIRSDGSNLAQIPKPRHPEWLEGALIMLESSNGNIDLYNVDTATVESTIGSKGTFTDPGQDKAYSPDGRWIVGSYKSGGSWAYEFYRLSDEAVYTATTTLTKDGVAGSTRIDGAPRWNRTSDAILVDGIVTEANASKGTREWGPKSCLSAQRSPGLLPGLVSCSGCENWPVSHDLTSPCL
jgi:hypothetical protein